MNKAFKIFVYAVLIALLLSSAAAANTDFNPGSKFGDWLSTNVTDLFPPLLAAIAVFFLLKRQTTAFISFIVFAMIVAVFVYAPDTIKNTGIDFLNFLMGR